jgi:hypothetical protein
MREVICLVPACHGLFVIVVCHPCDAGLEAETAWVPSSHTAREPVQGLLFMRGAMHGTRQRGQRPRQGQ